MSVILKIDGKAHEGWKSVRITRGLERVASDFDLTVTEKVAGTRDLPEIKPGKSCELLANGVLVVTGYVDEVNSQYDANSRSLTFRGRSKTGDLVDCSAVNEPGQWSDVNLAKIAADIAGPYGVSVVSPDTGENFSTFRLQQGETAFSAIERACRIRAFMATDDGQGRLVLTRAGTRRASTQIRCSITDPENSNVLTGSASVSHRDRYSKYLMKGQSVGTDDLFGDDAASPSATATDSGITRPRVLILQAETQAVIGGLRDRVNWEASIREGKALSLSYSLNGWAEADGTLWAPNVIASVVDDLNRIKGDFLVSEVSFSLDERGQITTLSLVPPEAFALIPEGEHGGKTDTLSQYGLN